MNTLFAKYMTMDAPVNGCLTAWQRISRPVGVVGAKF